MRLFDVKAARAEIEARPGAIRATRAIPAPPNSTNSTCRTPPTAEAAIPLDPEGLPFTACRACGGGDWWKPASLPFEGPGWACATCTPPGDALLRHACVVPVADLEVAPLPDPPPDPDAALDAFEERAAIRAVDGGQARAAAEAAALEEVARAAGLAPGTLQRLWAEHPDAGAYLAFLRLHGPHTYGAAASTLGWGATRAWQAEARLRAAGLAQFDHLGQAVPVTGGTP